MNGDDEEEQPKTQILDPFGSLPESPVEEEAKTVHVKEDKLESPQVTMIVKWLLSRCKNEILFNNFFFTTNYVIILTGIGASGHGTHVFRHS